MMSWELLTDIIATTAITSITSNITITILLLRDAIAIVTDTITITFVSLLLVEEDSGCLINRRSQYNPKVIVAMLWPMKSLHFDLETPIPTYSYNFSMPPRTSPRKPFKVTKYSKSPGHT